VSTPVIVSRDLTVRYGETVAIEDVDLTIEPGRVVGLIGMNGSGKSTYFKSLVGLVTPSSGTTQLFGGDPEDARQRSRVAYTPQNEAVDWTFPISVDEVVMMGRYGGQGWRRRSSRTDRDAVASALERVELTDLAHRQVGALSGGQRKRTFIARSLAQGAELLLLDEPFAGVDKRSEATIVDLLRALAAEGKTVIVSTHDLVAVPALCDEVVLLNRRVIAHGPTREILVPELIARAFGGFVPREMLETEAA
jgi:manganese transport system ATP-binding protein